MHLAYWPAARFLLTVLASIIPPLTRRKDSSTGDKPCQVVCTPVYALLKNCPALPRNHIDKAGPTSYHRVMVTVRRPDIPSESQLREFEIWKRYLTLRDTGMTIAAIAKLMGVTRQAVDYRLRKALRAKAKGWI